MKTDLIAIGNSKGLIIPAPVLKSLNIQDKLEIEVRKDMMLLRAANPRTKWEAAFQSMAEHKDDQLLIDDVFVDESLEEWEA